MTTSGRSAAPPAPVAVDPVSRRSRCQRLLDVYGGLLTEHQRQACRLHLDEDWSITELAEHLGCTRSGAHDLLRRALFHLDRCEARLGHAAELSRRDAVERELRARIARLEAGPRPSRAGGEG